MTAPDRPRFILHGAVVILIGMLCGLPTTVEQINGNERHWHTAHEALIMVGIWILATASALDVLVLERRERDALRWSALALGYGFSTALVLAAALNVDAFDPGGGAAHLAVFLITLTGLLGAFVLAALTIKGALAALRAPPAA